MRKSKNNYYNLRHVKVLKILHLDLYSFNFGNSVYPDLTHYIEAIVLTADYEEVTYDLQGFKDYEKAKEYLNKCKANKHLVLKSLNKEGE